MTSETVSATRRIDVPAWIVFGALADPTTHPSIDGTGWVAEPLDTEPLTETGQRFRMAMYHENHPDKDYEMTNEVVVFEPAQAIAWRPGQPDQSGEVQFGGWQWRYDLVADGDDATDVTLTYDWSGASERVRGFIRFPPFGRDHLGNSLAHLDEVASNQS